jgi:hypothetical protein
MRAPRFILYSHDGCGLGDLRRNLAIAAGLTREAPAASVLLLTGCIELGAHGLAPNVEIVALPALRKLGNGRYGAKRLPVSGSELRILRAALIAAAVESFRPGRPADRQAPDGRAGRAPAWAPVAPRLARARGGHGRGGRVRAYPGRVALTW